MGGQAWVKDKEVGEAAADREADWGNAAADLGVNSREADADMVAGWGKTAADVDIPVDSKESYC